MSNLLKKSKGFIIAVVILLIGFIVYNTYFKAPSESSALTSSSDAANASGTADNSIEEDFVNQLLALNSLKFDTSIFQNPLFQNLQDFSTTLNPVPSGRPNPFAPLGADVLTGTSSTTFLPFSQTGTSTATSSSSDNASSSNQ